MEEKETRVMNLSLIGLEARMWQEEKMSAELSEDLKKMWMDIDTGSFKIKELLLYHLNIFTKVL